VGKERGRRRGEENEEEEGEGKEEEKKGKSRKKLPTKDSTPRIFFQIKHKIRIFSG
jgi:hypothetical protein